MQHQVVQHQQAADALHGIEDEPVLGAVAELMDDGVVLEAARFGGVLLKRQYPQLRQVEGGRLGLVHEHVDLVARLQQPQDVGGVIGDPAGRGRQRREEGEPAHRVANSANSCGP